MNVAVLEKQSGLLRFESAYLSAYQLDQYCAYPYVNSRTRGAFDTFQGWNRRANGMVRGAVSLTVLLTEQGGGTAVNIRGNWTATGPAEIHTVNSKRVLEAEFQQSLGQQLASSGGTVHGADADLDARLKQLERLRDAGLINKSDYQRKRAELLRSF